MTPDEVRTIVREKIANAANQLLTDVANDVFKNLNAILGGGSSTAA